MNNLNQLRLVKTRTIKPLPSSTMLVSNIHSRPHHLQFKSFSHPLHNQHASSPNIATSSLYQLHLRPFFSASKTTPSLSISTRLINLSKLTILIITLIGTYGYLTDTRASLHSWLAVPLLKFISNDDPEKAHHIGVQILKFLGKFHLVQDHVQTKDQILSFELWGKKFNNPIGNAAGFDKNGDAIDGLFDVGFGYVEIGSVTPEPQPGNPKPRVFRIPSTESIINRYGFNSEGHFSVVSKLRRRILSYLDKHRHLGYSSILSKYDNMNPLQTAYADSGFTHLMVPDMIDRSLSLDQTLGELTNHIGIPRSLRDGRILAVNLGKNKASDQDSIQDFVIGIDRFGPLADALVINISSPNTPGLRNLQSKENMAKLLNQITKSRDNLTQNLSPDPTSPKPNVPAILIKIAPDLSAQELVDIGHLAKESKIDGIIISNTTTSRPFGSGREPEINETGGLSGPPLKSLSLKALSIIHSVTKGSVALIGCGGISRAEDVLEYGRAGASFVQLYSAFTYQGLGLPRKLKDGLIELLEKEENGKSWDQIVGSHAMNLDINQLIQDENRCRSSESSYEHQVKEIKETIDFIESSLQRLGMSNQKVHEIDSNVDHHQHQQQQTKLLTNPQELPTTSEKFICTSHDAQQPRQENAHQIRATHGQSPADSHPKDDERGILLDWKLKKQDEINRNDFKRIV